MELLSIFILSASFGIILGEITRPASISSGHELELDNNLLTFILGLENRVKVLEDSRVEDSMRINNMQSEIDKLRYENDQLRGQFHPIHSVKTVTPVKVTKLPQYHYNDSPLDKYKLNNETVVMTTQEEESGTKDQDIPQQGKVANRSLFTHREAPIIPTGRLSKRVASTGTVAFHANLAANVNSPAMNRELVFDRIVTNNGNGYSQHTGTFTCQESGTYAFSWNIVSLANHFIDSHLVRNGDIIASIVSSSAHHTGSSTGMAAIQLNTGDDVWVKLGNRENDASVLAWSMFSGFQLN